MRLIVLVFPLQGIEPGLFQSTTVSPIPSPTPMEKASILATTMLPRCFRAWIHDPGSLFVLKNLLPFVFP
jgi:hypothetical protein